ncbi:MAG: alanine--tRNA ligase [Oscillospiraceae bacterium]|jgi:alanyl-tRNA synthetase|nr:alanine--tRNA ligase [Oscillospiraceae bacterium]MDD3260703.1 alanine--tRNA ligase [Oscillospiraceae bacterium]
MQWMGLNEIREKYLEFFESKGHLRLPSFSLIPKDDNSLLLINSGMAPMKKYFTGEVTPPRKRVTTCQKCIRTGDIENVGITDRHGTFFEMLGNFSFGDYFKHEATAWAWEFCTKVMEMPEDKLWVTIYQDDDEAFDIWTKEVGVSADRIVRLGKEDNFWEHGPGPCGPCSEIYFDRGPEHSCGKPTCGVGCDCDRYVEFWNVVFSQFDCDGHGGYPPMEHPNIDTGMGLERLACVMQNVDNLFLVDTVQNIVKKVCEIAKTEYGKNKKNDVSIRVITDHVRSVTFMIADGIMPSNTGRGYVLRRLLRRAARHGKLLGIDHPFLTEVAQMVIHESCGAYPELSEKQEMIQKVISVEEESFSKTIDQGTALLGEIMQHSKGTVISGEDAFKLSDTYGFPIDLTKEIAAESGMTVDEETYQKRMQEQRKTARDARKNAGAESWEGESDLLKGVPETDFLGYKEKTADAKVLAILKDGARAESADAGDEIGLVLDRTTFYGESGGQVGDTGSISADDAVLAVSDTTKNHAKNVIHHCSVQAGTIRVGDAVAVKPDWKRREAIMRNHTAAHLLQAALRRVLGTHVEQAGQLVNEKHVRFDFTHFAALTAEELQKVETMVNEVVLSAVPVETREMPIEEAKKLGAMALFGEKYGKIVRVVSVGDFSREFCGGTHVDNTAKLGLFKIVSETSASAGVRRIEAVTGYGVYSLLNDSLKTISSTAAALKLNSTADLPQHAEQVVSQLKQTENELQKTEAKLAAGEVNQMLANAQQAGSVKVCTGKLSGADAAALRTMCDKARDKDANVVAVFAGVNGAKANFAVAVGKEAQKKGAHAGKIAKAVAQLAGGNGGGKPDFAMAGAKDLSKLDAALAAAADIVAGFVQ